MVKEIGGPPSTVGEEECSGVGVVGSGFLCMN